MSSESPVFPTPDAERRYKPTNSRTAGCDEPRKNPVKVRFTDEEMELVEEFAACLSIAKASAVRVLVLKALRDSTAEKELNAAFIESNLNKLTA